MKKNNDNASVSTAELWITLFIAAAVFIPTMNFIAQKSVDEATSALARKIDANDHQIRIDIGRSICMKLGENNAFFHGDMARELSKDLSYSAPFFCVHYERPENPVYSHATIASVWVSQDGVTFVSVK